ncbi:AGAP011891-PA [Anopheles gambiae str. PEST]|nr:AGAP011891-PA [Anopheles gambiae str. PEST]
MRGNKSNKTERLNLKMSNYLYPRHVAKPSSPEEGIRKQEEKSFQYITTRRIATFANGSRTTYDGMLFTARD